MDSASPRPYSPFNAEGRLSVLAYTAHSLVATMVCLVPVAVLLLATGGNGLDEFGGELLSRIPGWVWMIVLVLGAVFTWVSTCLSIKRLHDLERTGWWVLALLLPVVGLIPFLYLLVPGKELPNAYGPWRPTRTWEKIAGGPYILLFLLLPVVPLLNIVMN